MLMILHEIQKIIVWSIQRGNACICAGVRCCDLRLSPTDSGTGAGKEYEQQSSCTYKKRKVSVWEELKYLEICVFMYRWSLVYIDLCQRWCVVWRFECPTSVCPSVSIVWHGMKSNRSEQLSTFCYSKLIYFYNFDNDACRCIAPHFSGFTPNKHHWLSVGGGCPNTLLLGITLTPRCGRSKGGHP